MRHSESYQGHHGVGGVQNHSCGPVWPWVVYTVKHYLPIEKAPEAAENYRKRFLWAEIRAKNAETGRDITLTCYKRMGYGEGCEIAANAHARADKKIQRIASREATLTAALDTMKRVRNYGRAEG